jgi:hypothetical protein
MPELTEIELTPLEVARKLIEEEAQAKRQAFMDAYQALCKEHGMELIATAQFGIQPLRG